MRAIVLLTCAMLVFGGDAYGKQDPAISRMFRGKCGPESWIRYWRPNSANYVKVVPFQCDTAVVAEPTNSTQLVHFLVSNGSPDAIWGFLGKKRGTTGLVVVQQFYPDSAPKGIVSHGACVFSYRSNGKPRNLTCYARSVRGPRPFEAVAQLNDITEL